MLKLTIPALELYDDKNRVFINQDEVTVELEHSLIALSQWESKWEKPFLGPDQKTTEETIDYVRCMSLTPNVSPEVFNRLNDAHLNEVNKYIDAKMSATWFTEPGGATKTSKRPRETITAEIIYYWIISLNLNWETQHWHLNRLFTLIKVCNQKNAPEKKRSRRDMVAERQRINAERRAQYGTSG